MDDVKGMHRMNEGYQVCGALKRINAKCLYEGVIVVPSVMYIAEAWRLRSAERRKFNVLEI